MSSQTKTVSHTPGPLTIRRAPQNLYIEDAQYTVVATVFIPHLDPGEAEANAILFTAAPALLEALKETLRALESHLDESCRDHNIKHRDQLCPCNQNEVVRARTAIR